MDEQLALPPVETAKLANDPEPLGRLKEARRDERPRPLLVTVLQRPPDECLATEENLLLPLTGRTLGTMLPAQPTTLLGRLAPQPPQPHRHPRKVGVDLRVVFLAGLDPGHEPIEEPLRRITLRPHPARAHADKQRLRQVRRIGSSTH